MNAHDRIDFDADEPPEPMDDLRRAWNELPTPPIERIDAADQEIERWMRAAWAQVQVPAARPRARWRPSIVSAFAAAALVCIAVGLGLRPDAPISELDPSNKHVAAVDSFRPSHRITPTVVSTLDVALPPTSRTVATSNRLVDQAYASNRAGLYREAAAFATVALDAAATNAEVRCAALVNWIHAEQAMGRVDEAERLSTTLALALSR